MSYDAWGVSWGTPSAWGISWVVNDSKTGAGGIDPGEGGSKRSAFKPTGLVDRPRRGKQTAVIEDRIEQAHKEARQIAVEAKQAEAFDVERLMPAETMTAAERDFEIALLLHKRIKTEEDDMLLLILMAAGAA